MRQRAKMGSVQLFAATAITAATFGFATGQVLAADKSPMAPKPQQESQATPEKTPESSTGGSTGSGSMGTGQSTAPGTSGSSPSGSSAETQGSTTTAPTITKAEVVGKELRSANGDNFGEIEGVVESGGKVSAVLVDVGGFLGLGSKRVAVPVSEISPQGDHVLAKGMTQEEIEKLPEHKGKGAKQGAMPK